MVAMAKELPKRGRGRPRKNQVGTANLHTKIDPVIMDRLRLYMDGQRYQPTLREVLELAIQEFLDREDTKKS